MRILLPNATAFSEFWGFNDTCGPAALAMNYHSVFGDAISGPIIDSIRADMVARKLFDHGCTLSELDIENRIGKGRQSYFPSAWRWRSPQDPDVIRPGIYANAGHVGLVCQVQAAYKLPYNEAGVNVHFIALLGQDTVTGEIAIGNGDDVMALNANNGHGKAVPIRWISWSQLWAAGPSGLLGIYNAGGPFPVGIPNGWTDDGTTLKAPNGIGIVRGFRNYVLSHGWDPNNYPLEIERAASPVERSNPSLGAGSVQTFRYDRLAWTSKMGVYMSWIGQELLYDEAHLQTGAGPIRALDVPLLDDVKPPSQNETSDPGEVSHG